MLRQVVPIAFSPCLLLFFACGVGEIADGFESNGYRYERCDGENAYIADSTENAAGLACDDKIWGKNAVAKHGDRIFCKDPDVLIFTEPGSELKASDIGCNDAQMLVAQAAGDPVPQKAMTESDSNNGVAASVSALITSRGGPSCEFTQSSPNGTYCCNQIEDDRSQPVEYPGTLVPTAETCDGDSLASCDCGYMEWRGDTFKRFNRVHYSKNQWRCVNTERPRDQYTILDQYPGHWRKAYGKDLPANSPAGQCENEPINDNLPLAMWDWESGSISECGQMLYDEPYVDFCGERGVSCSSENTNAHWCGYYILPGGLPSRA